MYVHRGVCTGTCEDAIIGSPTDEKCEGHAALAMCSVILQVLAFGLLGSNPVWNKR